MTVSVSMPLMANMTYWLTRDQRYSLRPLTQRLPPIPRQAGGQAHTPPVPTYSVTPVPFQAEEWAS
jgi:hypothetical protein